MSRPLESSGPCPAPQTVAAVDLGSNSFYMIVTRAQGERVQVLDRLKETVRLAAGLSERRTLDPDACERALACLERFGQRLRGLAHDHVRVVGTSALRRARDADAFIERAGIALGHPVEVVYGAEEARLIYGGVVQDLGEEWPRRLVVDIGGGSTELIIGEHATPLLVESVSLGAVDQMKRFFPDGRIRQDNWQAAVTDVRLRLEPIARRYREAGWDLAVGASGSVKSILSAANARSPGQAITPDGLAWLARRVIRQRRVSKLDLAGVSADRRAIFPGGLAVLTGIFESLEIESMRVSDKALREGVVADLLGRLQDRDAREAGVRAASRRYEVDRAHAERVASTATRLLTACDDAGAMNPSLLRWAALLHEIGLAISHKAYHKHGEYILINADLQGFSQAEQRLLAGLVRLHRGAFRTEFLDALGGPRAASARRMAIALRLAVILHRGRDPQADPPVQLLASGKRLHLGCTVDWLTANPLTQADLAREARQLARADIRLVWGGDNHG